MPMFRELKLSLVRLLREAYRQWRTGHARTELAGPHRPWVPHGEHNLWEHKGCLVLRTSGRAS